MQKTKKLIVIGALILICLFLVRVYTNQIKQNSPHSASIKIESSPLLNKERGLGGEVDNTATLEINGIKYESKISSKISVYDFMEQLKSEGKITFTEKNYIGMGKFIEEINGIKSDGENYWIYYVNGKKANIGISNYKINSGDIVSWKYEKNIY